ncbi:MAG: transposase, partial [Prevotellaceae bacterium]|nr:transposase [Prevotellaceae bacterium]
METVQQKALVKENESLKKEVERLLSLNEKLKDELLYLRRTLFGRSSERFITQDPNQLPIAFEGMEQLPEEKQVEEAQKETITYERKKKVEHPAQAVRQALPA